MPGFPKDRPPANHRALERWITDKSREDGIAVDRARRALSFMVVSAVLSTLIDAQVSIPTSVLARPEQGEPHRSRCWF